MVSTRPGRPRAGARARNHCSPSAERVTPTLSRESPEPALLERLDVAALPLRRDHRHEEAALLRGGGGRAGVLVLLLAARLERGDDGVSGVRDGRRLRAEVEREVALRRGAALPGDVQQGEEAGPQPRERLSAADLLCARLEQRALDGERRGERLLPRLERSAERLERAGRLGGAEPGGAERGEEVAEPPRLAPRGLETEPVALPGNGGEGLAQRVGLHAEGAGVERREGRGRAGARDRGAPGGERGREPRQEPPQSRRGVRGDLLAGGRARRSTRSASQSSAPR